MTDAPDTAADVDDAHRQSSHAVRLEWGPTGAAAIAAGCDVAVVVDVLSFTTTLTVALDRGMTVLPFRWKDQRAQAWAEEHDAVLAVGRLEARHGQAGVSLSPASMAAVEGVERVVLPSPNGSAISFALRDAGCTVVGASLRNAAAVGEWLRPRVESGALVAVVPAGERWPDGSLRPAVEDLWGAGAVLSTLARGADTSSWSPEARLAAAAHDGVQGRLGDELLACASGRELVDKGFASDVWIASEVAVSTVVPVLDGASFTDAGPGSAPVSGRRTTAAATVGVLLVVVPLVVAVALVATGRATDVGGLAVLAMCAAAGVLVLADLRRARPAVGPDRPAGSRSTAVVVAATVGLVLVGSLAVALVLSLLDDTLRGRPVAAELVGGAVVLVVAGLAGIAAGRARRR